MRVSTSPKHLRHRGDVHRFWAAAATLGGALIVLGIYLFRAVEPTGDGAAYVLQALEGSPWDRSVHVGYLAPLWIWVRGWVALGVHPAAAANLLGAAWTLGGLGLAAALGAELLNASQPSPRSERTPMFSVAMLLAPAALATSAVVWDAALFCEVYGPLAATTTGVAWALRTGRDRLAATAAVLAILIHPGAVTLAPGLLLLGGVDLRSRRAAIGSGAVALAAGLAVAALSPDWWTGGRGVLTASPMDRSVWGALQDAWRLLDAATSLPILLGVLVASAGVDRRAPGLRSALLALPVLAVGAALGLGRWSDNPGQLPTLFAAAAFAPLALHVPFGPTNTGRRLGALWPGALVLLLGLGLAEASSAHDARARSATAENGRLAETCAERSDSWALQKRRELACRAPSKPRGVGW